MYHSGLLPFPPHYLGNSSALVDNEINNLASYNKGALQDAQRKMLIGSGRGRVHCTNNGNLIYKHCSGL